VTLSVVAHGAASSGDKHLSLIVRVGDEDGKPIVDLTTGDFKVWQMVPFSEVVIRPLNIGKAMREKRLLDGLYDLISDDWAEAFVGGGTFVFFIHVSQGPSEEGWALAPVVKLGSSVEQS
jgi:hypothetical protein